MQAHVCFERLGQALRTTIINLVLTKVNSLKTVSYQYNKHY